jgi:hypothetical protein
MKEIRKINHFPKAGFVCIKDQLYRMLKKQRALYGNIYNFTPLTFNLPNDYSRFLDIFMKRQLDPSDMGHHANKNDFYAIKDDQIAQSTIYA